MVGEKGELGRKEKRRKERKKEGERTMGEGVKKEERQRARRRRDTDRACYFQKPFFASIVCRETGISEKREFTPISKSLTSFLTDVVSALLFN